MENNTNNTNSQNVENVENVENVLSEIEQKAQRVLRAKLPNLSEKNFNFEKRTGNLFTASIVKCYNEDGTQTIEQGAHKEKLVRSVIHVEDENGVIFPEFEAIELELSQKRSAALVLSADKLKEKMEAKKAALMDEILTVERELDHFEYQLSHAIEVVNEVELPEPASNPTATIKAKLSDATEKMAKMRALLLASGMSESEIDQTING